MIGIILGRFDHALFAQVGKRINAKVPFYLRQAEAGGDQLVLGIGIDSVEAGMGHRWRTDAHVHLGGTGIPQGCHQLATGGATHNRIIDHHNPLAREHIR